MPATLHERTLDLLKKDPRPRREISDATKIPFCWLRKFLSREIKEPGVNRVQKLYEFLSSKPLL